MTDDRDLDEIDIHLRPAADVGGRLLALVALARRGFLERPLEKITDDTPEAERFDLISWLSEERLTDYLAPAERAMLERPIGALSAEDAVAATWSIEGAAALAWALDLLPMIPGYDETTAAAAVIEALPATWSRTTEFRSGAKLRTEAEIATERERAEIWHDRADQYWQMQEGWEPDLIAPWEVIAAMADEAHAAGLLARPVDGDFPTRLGPYAILPPEIVEELELIAFHRLVALNWLCGLTGID